MHQHMDPYVLGIYAMSERSLIFVRFTFRVMMVYQRVYYAKSKYGIMRLSDLLFIPQTYSRIGNCMLILFLEQLFFIVNQQLSIGSFSRRFI